MNDMSQRMFHQGLYSVLLFQLAISVVLEVAYSLPLEEKIEPVELFHRCIDPEKDENVPDKSPVLLIHSLMCSHKCYDGVDQFIADKTKRKVCSIDLRNHGDSPWNNRTDVAALATDIGHFLDTQGIKKVNLIGESLGGKVAIHYTLNNPDRVDSIVAEDVRPNTIRKIGYLGLKFMAKIIKNLIESQPKGMNEDEAKKWAEQQAKSLAKQVEAYQKLPDDLSKLIDLRFINGKWQLKHNLDLAYEKIDKPEEIWTESTGLYEGPTLFIYGTESVFKVNEDEENILKLFPHAKLIPIEGAGHLIHEVHREFEDIIVKFLDEIN